MSDKVETYITLRGRRRKTGDMMYVCHEARSSNVVMGVSDEPANLAIFSIDSRDEITRALKMLKDHVTVDQNTVEIVFLQPVTNPFEDETLSDIVQRIALGSLSKTEIEALGLVERIVYHKLADDNK